MIGLVVAAGALAGCAPKPEPATARGSRPAALAPARAAAPGSDGAFGRPSALTPRLQGLIRALKGQQKGQLFRLRDLLAKQIPELATPEARSLPEEASVEVFEVARGYPLVAFVQVTGKGHVRCGDYGETKQEVYALHVARDERGVERIAFDTSDFSASETKLFASTNPRVVFPRLTSRIPAFEIHFDYQPPCSGEAASGKMVEVYHLASAAKVGEFSTDTRSAVPGMSSSDRSTLEWVMGKTPDTAYLVTVGMTTGTIHPCTGEPDNRSAECRPKVECKRTVSVVAFTPKGSEALDPAQLELLRQREPGLSRLPRNASGSTAAACDLLAP